MAGRAIVGADPHVDAQSLKVFDARQHRTPTRSVEQRNTLRMRHAPRRIPVTAAAEIFLWQGQKRCLADAAGHQYQMLSLGRWKAVAQRSPDLQRLAWLKLSKLARHAAQHQIDNVHALRLTVGRE